jgi:clan AA aspartic protease
MIRPVGKNYRQRDPLLEANSIGEKKMGLVYADIELISSDDVALHRHGVISEDQIKRMTVNVLVDSGALMLTINDRIKAQLALPHIETSTAQLANGVVIEVEIVGPVEVRFENRRASVEAMVLPGDVQPLLGAIPVENMDVLVDPQRGRLIVNPEHPQRAQHSLK